MWVTVLSAAVLLGDADAASDAVADTGSCAWRFQLTPYVWAAGMNGRIKPAPGLPTVEVDRSFSELLSNSDGAFFLTGSARTDDWVLMGDFTWSSSSQAGQVSVPGAPVPLPASGGTEQTSLTLAAGRTLARNEGHHLELYAGARFWRVEADAEIPPLALQASERFSWADPIAGVRFNTSVTPRLSAIVQADLGGGAFGGADATLQMLAVANWQVTPRAYVSAGYRHLSFDYRKDGRILDIALNGPLLGVTWRF